MPGPRRGIAKKPTSPLKPIVDAYNAGHFKEAETQAFRIIEKNKGSKDPIKLKQSAQARYITAFAAARLKNMKLARDRFAVLKSEAARLPDRGKHDVRPGEVVPNLEEQAAYQHAVCTAALGDKTAAEAEYMKFMADYPECPLISAAAKRIELLHNGHMPSAAEAAWEKASKIALARQRVRDKALRKEQSKCGPECLAEILRRNGKPADVNALAAEMKTNEMGTSLLALASTAKKHGLPAKGYQLTQQGLAKQKLPVIALIMPGHYVIVEKITSSAVTIWDPYGKGIGKPATLERPIQRWKFEWRGIALVFGENAK